MKNVFLSDVLGQPEALGLALNEYRAYAVTLAHLTALKPRQVLFAGMGSSHYCSQSAVIRLNQAGVAARMESASQILYYEMGAITPDTLLVLTSQSGESGEIVKLIQRLPADQPVVGITNQPGSVLGRRADFLLPMQVEDELAVSTRTYLASLILSDLLTSALLNELSDDSYGEVERALDALAHFLDGHAEHTRHMEEYLGLPPFLCTVGRGHSRSSAECGALFIRETAKYPGIAFDAGEFRHGPYEMVEPGFASLLFAPEGATGAMVAKLADDIAVLGGRAVLISGGVSAADERVLTLQYRRVPERLSPLVDIVGAQLFANYAALRRNFTPGVFRQSQKITRKG